MPLLVVGLSHKTAPLEIREQLAFEPYQWQEVAEKLDQYSELQEKVLLSTTNRVEVYARVKEVEQGRERIVQFLSDYHGVPERAFRSYLYHFVEGEAIRHLFRVASSLDSMVVGEPQILGQVQEAYNRAKAHGMVGNVLGALFEKSFSVAKRVHTETQIAENAVSISFAAVELAKKIFVDLHHCTAMLIGTGEMAELAAQHLLHHGVRTLLICSRPFERAVAVAERLDGDAIQYDHLFTYLETADIVLGSMPTRHPVLTRAAVQEVIRRRRYRPMFFIDMAAPRNIDPSVNAISNVYLYDVDDLQNVVNTNIRQRQQEAAIAEELVNREAVAFQRWLNSLDVAPTIVSLQQKAESIRQQELSQLLDHLPTLSEQEREAIEAFSIAMVDKLLSTPIMNLQKGVKAPEGNKLLQAVRQLFDLNERWHRPIRIGSRGSSLALRQTEWVQRQLASLFPHITFEKLIIKTSGDVIRDVPLPTVGDKGFFVKEIEEALLQNRIDLAVHSIKDLPSRLPSGLTVGAIPRREDPRDVLISRSGLPLHQLPKGSRVGTSSLRRQAQLLHYRPDLVIVPVRGNIDTRLRKLAEGEYDAIVLAAAGLLRMGWAQKITEYLSPDICLPAVGQGALGIEIREEDQEVEALVHKLHSPETEAAIIAERAFLHHLGGGCQVPVGALGRIEANRLVLRGMISSVNGKRLLTGKREGAISEAVTIGRALAEDLLDAGGRDILAEIERGQKQKGKMAER